MASNTRQKLKRVKEKDIPQFQCQTCSKILADKTCYQIHMQLHSDELPWPCDLCSYRGKIKKYLSRHKKKVHTAAMGPQCTVCNKVFHFTANLKQHMRVHTGEKPHQCQACGKAFSSTYCLNMHKLIHTNQKPYHCTFCDYACRDSSTLRKHQDRHLGIKPKTNNCLKCKKKYKTKELLKIHVDEVHRGLNTRQYPCEQCDKLFKTKSVLRMHIKRVHEGETKTVCDICDKVLSKYNMANHLLKHVDIRPFKCNFKGCGKRFKDKSGLKKHTLIHYPEYQIQCDLCDARFTRKFRFRAHKAKHFAEDGYECDYCGITIHSKMVLATHITKKHKNVQKFICDLCGINAFTRKAITLHLQYGHGGLYDKTCQLCSKELESSKILKKHYLKIHNIKYTIQKSPEDIVIKEEPLEINAEFEFNYDVQKIEIDAEPIPDPQYADSVSTLAYSKQVLEEDMRGAEGGGEPDCEFDEFIQNVVRKNCRKEHRPEYADTETTLAYSKKVLEEDMSMAGYRQPDSAFDKFFRQQVMKKPKTKPEKNKRKEPGKTKKTTKRKKARVDVVKLKRMKKTIHKMLQDSKVRREIAMLENMRRNYNTRIKRAHHSASKKVSPQIKYFKKSEDQTVKIDTDKTEFDKTIPISADTGQTQTNIDENNETLLNKNLTNTVNAESDEIIEKNSLSNDDLEINKVENGISTQNEEVNDSQIENTENNNVNLPSSEENVLDYEGIDQSDETSSKHLDENIILNDSTIEGNIINENISLDNRISSNNHEILPNDKETIVNRIVNENNDNNHETSPNKEIRGDQMVDENTLIEENNDNYDNMSQQDKVITGDQVDKNLSLIDINNDNNDETLPHNKDILDQIVDKNISSIDESNDIDENNDNEENNDKHHEILQETDESHDTKRPKRNRNKKRIEYNENDNDKGESNRNGKLKFLGHECYICFKIFKTKDDLKSHCYEHFNICNEQMLKKCPFCGYVTNRGIKNHIELYHNLNINYAYGQVTKKKDKYLFEIDDDCQLEIIPSISNLNRLAGLQHDEKNRKNKNVFLGKTKLVKKGKEWVVEKQAVSVSNEFILPEFTEEEYLQIKIEGDSYCDRLKKLGFLAKKRGGKMLYPCSECEKLCQTLSALKLHNRMHEANPKKYKPKVWVNRHIEYTTAKKKSVRTSNKTIKRKKKMREEKKAQKEKPVKFVPVKKPVSTENRYAAPQPVKNKHKCDKKLIEFYKSNIKGGDIEFWQFLKIFNKMGRENVNTFDDLINRDDVHFGIHVKDNTDIQTVTENIVVEPDFVEKDELCNDSINTEKIPVKPKKTGFKNKQSKFTRAIMISRKEYLRRNEMKNEMRKRLAENKKVSTK